jgi:hypothetical protein
MQPAEKEVSMNSASNPSTPTDGRNMPFRMRNHPSVNGLNTNGLTTVTTNSSQVSSIPASPAGGQYRNPAFDPRNVASRVFGASPQHEMSNPYEQIRVTPPKPMGFAYNPRDLRNAMLNRAAAENAAAASASIRGDSPAPPSSARSQYYQSSPAFGDPVELPAIELPASAVQVSHRPSHETLGRESMNSRASNHPTPASATATTGDTPSFNFNLPDPDPVELSAVPASRKPAPTASAPSSSTAARKDLSVEENITLPVPEQQQQQQRPNSRPPPPLPPKDDPSPDQRPPPRSPIDFLGASTKTSDSQTVSSSRVQTKAPVIGDIPGLRDESGKGLDLGLGGVNGNDEDKPPAWL